MTSRRKQIEAVQNAANIEQSDGSSSCSFEIGWGGSVENRLAFEKEWNQLCIQLQTQERLVAECLTQKQLAAVIEFDLYQRPEDSSGRLLCAKPADPIQKAHEKAQAMRSKAKSLRREETRSKIRGLTRGRGEELTAEDPKNHNI